MRQGQQHQKRMRGRNNNRKGPNPLSRSYESNGPDVKIRGNAAHIAEKYVQLARDAQSSGDPISAENYLQHAEHYFRIVAANQPQFPQQQANPQGFARADDEDGDEDSGEAQVNGHESHNHGGQHGGQAYPQNAAQPYQGEGQPREQRAQPAGSETGLPAFITGGDGSQGQDRSEGQGRNRRNRRYGRYGRNGSPGEAGGQDSAPSAEPEVTPGE